MKKVCYVVLQHKTLFGGKNSREEKQFAGGNILLPENFMFDWRIGKKLTPEKWEKSISVLQILFLNVLLMNWIGVILIVPFYSEIGLKVTFELLHCRTTKTPNAQLCNWINNHILQRPKTFEYLSPLRESFGLIATN